MDMCERKPGEKWTSEAVWRAATRYQSACVLVAACELDVFSALHDGPATATDIAAARDCDPRGMTALLDALAATDLLIKRDNTYAPADGVLDTLTADGSDSYLSILQHFGATVRRWSQLAAVVKNGRPAEAIRA